ncbi:MAG: MBL fold metallo-hydrolase [Mollicutes bacterium]|nr:MBL fold metallo-hydrolase [Mollicutes bacterium]
MNKLTMIGTGHGFVHNLYNTCFVVNNNFLIDTGGSADIVKNLELLGINISNIHDIFISHSHTDHLLGLFWFLKRLTGMYRNGEYIGKLNIYCNDEVECAIKDIYKHLYPDVYVDAINEYMNIIVVDDGEEVLIQNQTYKFIDMKSGNNKLYGFETAFNNGKTLVFCGDGTLKKELYDIIKNKDYVMHEAFCLDADKEIFKPYEKKHSTVKYVCENFNDLNIKNLILFHTEDSHPSDKDVLYKKEAKEYFDNNVIVPKDLDVIEI